MQWNERVRSHIARGACHRVTPVLCAAGEKACSTRPRRGSCARACMVGNVSSVCMHRKHVRNVSRHATSASIATWPAGSTSLHGIVSTRAPCMRADSIRNTPENVEKAKTSGAELTAVYFLLHPKRKSQGKSPEHNQASHAKHPHSLEWHNSTMMKIFPSTVCRDDQIVANIVLSDTQIIVPKISNCSI